MKKLWTIQDVKRYAQDNGSHWFDADAMRISESRLLSDVVTAEIYGELHHYFISSERYESTNPRCYQIHVMDSRGSVHTLGFAKTYRSPAAARRALAKHVATRV